MYKYRDTQPISEDPITRTGSIVSIDNPDDVLALHSIKANIEPIQNGEPWMSALNVEPYQFRQVPTQSHEFGYEIDKLVGGTVAWNQLLKNADFASGMQNWNIGSNATASVSNGVLTAVANGTPTGNQYVSQVNLAIPPGHKMLWSAEIASNSAQIAVQGVQSSPWATVFRQNVSVTSTLTPKAGVVAVGSGNTVNGFFFLFDNKENVIIKTPQLFDLTQMFGSTIADYIYALEQANAGAGVAWFKKLFPKPYYAYNAGELKSVSGLVSHDMTGFNQWDEEWGVGGINSHTGEDTESTKVARSKNFIPVLPNTVYYNNVPAAKWGGNANFRTRFYDAGKNYIGFQPKGQVVTFANNVFTTPDNCYFMRFETPSEYGTSYANDICINLSWDGSRNGEYEPYELHSYPLDSDLTLRGIPKLDANNNLYYDGDVYEPSGEVTRKYGVVDLGTLTWTKDATGVSGKYRFAALVTGIKPNSANNARGNVVCSKYETVTPDIIWNVLGDGIAVSVSTAGKIIVLDSAHNDSTTAQFKTAMSGVYLVYELATPTTESADPYTNPQIVDRYGTEEYVTTSIVPIGHSTNYANICPISGYDEVNVYVSPTTSETDATVYTTNLNGTRYGGTLNMSTGVLTVDRQIITFDGDESWTIVPADAQAYFLTTLPNIYLNSAAKKPIMCDSFETRTDGASTSYPDGTAWFIYRQFHLKVGNEIAPSGISSQGVAELKTWLANNPVSAVFPLATPTTVQLTAEGVELLAGTNNIWADSGDVSVTYAIDLDRYVIKPAEAVSINGKYLEDIVKGYRTLYVKGRESLAVDLDTYSVGTSNGEKIKGSKYPARTLTIGFQLLCDTNEEFRQRFNQLNNILSIGEADFVFNDEKDKFFTGVPIMDADIEAGRNNVTGEWTIYCAYPFKRSVQPITLTSTDAVIAGNTATFTFNYDGVMPAKPVLRAEFASAKVGGDYSEDGDCGYVAFLNQDESIIQLGNPDVIDVDADNKNETLINSAFDALTNWAASGISLANIADPYWNKGAGQTMKFARGTGTLTRSIANTINFEFDVVQRLCVSSPTQAGTFKALLKNGNTTVVGYIIEKAGSGTTANVKYILNDIVVGADTIDVSYYNTNFGYCNRTPVYVTQNTYTLVREFIHGHGSIGVFRPVKAGTRQVQDGWNYTQSNLNSGISRSGSVVTFSVGNLPDRTFKSSDIEATPCSNVTFETTGTFNTNAIRSACLVKKAGVPFADIPNVFTAGDIVEADCNSADVFLYRAGSVDGHLEPQYGALGNDWETFEIKVGQNIIRAVWSEWVNTNYKPVVKIIFNKVYI